MAFQNTSGLLEKLKSVFTSKDQVIDPRRRTHIPSDLIEKLKLLFTGKDQVTSPHSPGYDESLKRWSDLASQRAVRNSFHF
jgi:hypothetical protein